MSIAYKKCPKCGSKNSLKIIYGLPGIKLVMEEAEGKVKLGGCCIFENSPEYYCTECENEWSREQATDAAYNKIQTIETSVGGYFGGYNYVTIDLRNLKITLSNWGGGKEQQIINKAIKASTVKKFIDQLKTVDLLNWKSKYDSDVCDGTQWSVDILADGKTIKKYGSNNFPDEWDMFCRLISDISKTEFR